MGGAASPRASWATRASVTLVALAAAALGWAMARSGAPPPPGPVAPAPSATAAQCEPAGSAASSASVASATATAPGPEDLASRAAAGDLEALKRLESIPVRDRPVADAVAIASGHAALARADAARLVADLGADPKLLQDRATLAYAYRLALDPEVAPVLLRGLAELEHAVIADLLYDIAARGEPGARLVLLARDVLEGPSVRREASPALSVLLDLEAAEQCWQYEALLARAAEHADSRALRLLERLAIKTGCGKKKDEDCWACLREGASRERLERATDGAKERRYDAPWARKAVP